MSMFNRRTNQDHLHHDYEARDLDEVAEDMESEVRQLVGRSSPPPPRMPDYVEHNPEVDQVGRLTAEALVMTYEASAKQIEGMGSGLADAMDECRKTTTALVKELERVEQETEEAVKQCLEAAEVYRAQAKELFAQIQNRAMLAAKVRETATAMIEDLKK
jgi:cell division septum initiation protein DivIVA